NLFVTSLVLNRDYASWKPQSKHTKGPEAQRSKLCAKVQFFMVFGAGKLNGRRHQCEATTLRPMMEPMSVVMKTKRHSVAGSLKKRIPTNTVPTAPMPVHTA